jgi:hypothetical protein
MGRRWNGGKVLRYVKKNWNGLRCNWQKNRMTKVHTKLTVMKKTLLKKMTAHYKIVQSLKGTEI